MSSDIFANPVIGPPRTNYGFATDPVDGVQDRGASTLVPRAPDMQISNSWRSVEEGTQGARKANTTENRQKDAATDAAEKERKRIDFHFCRAFPGLIDKGWKRLHGEFEDEQIRVYTTDYEYRRFWGIKPAGMAMYDFWEQNDPDVTRYDDNIAITWEDPLIPPPVTEDDEPVIWAGKGLNPDITPQKQPTPEPPLLTKVAKRRQGQDTTSISPNHRVKKSTPPAKTKKKSTRKSSPDKDARLLEAVEDHLQEQAETAHVNDRYPRAPSAATSLHAQHEHAANHGDPAPSKRARGRPANKANPAPKKHDPPTPKRPRGRPAKEKPAASSEDASLPKRPRGRPPANLKSAAVKGNARITKPSQRAPAPSKHKMRTRNKGTAELLQLPY